MNKETFPTQFNQPFTDLRKCGPFILFQFDVNAFFINNEGKVHLSINLHEMMRNWIINWIRNRIKNPTFVNDLSESDLSEPNLSEPDLSEPDLSETQILFSEKGRVIMVYNNHCGFFDIKENPLIFNNFPIEYDSSCKCAYSGYFDSLFVIKGNILKIYCMNEHDFYVTEFNIPESSSSIYVSITKIAIEYPDTIVFWNISRTNNTFVLGETIVIAKLHNEPLNNIIFSSDERYAYINGSLSNDYICEMNYGECVTYGERALDINFSPDNNLFAYIDNKNNIVIRDISGSNQRIIDVNATSILWARKLFYSTIIDGQASIRYIDENPI